MKNLSYEEFVVLFLREISQLSSRRRVARLKDRVRLAKRRPMVREWLRLRELNP